MRKAFRLFLIGACCAFGASLTAQQNNVENFCDPGARDDCIPDTLEIVFVPGGTSEFVYDPFVAGTQIDCEALSETKTANVQGWSYAVAHDDAFLTLIEDTVTTVGTIVDPDHPNTVTIPPNFDVTNAVPGGWISAIVLSFIQPTQLPLDTRNSIAKASYTLTADAGVDGTLIKYVDDQIGAPGSPNTAINITVDGVAKLPETMIQGLVRFGGGGPPPETECADGIDNDEDGAIDCMDDDCCANQVACPPGTGVCPGGGECPDWALYFGPTRSDAVFAGGANDIPISMRNAGAAFAFSLGAKRTGQTYEFSGTLGADATRLVELIITDDQGDSKTPLAGNTATSTADPAMLTIARGSALTPFADGDFFAADTDPGVGGPGFTVGYVSDLDSDTNKIPATPGPDPCSVNEVLIMQFGVQPTPNFQRGDVNGDGKINVTDPVWIVQLGVGNTNFAPVYNCDDARDANNNGSIGDFTADAVFLLNWIFDVGAATRPDQPFLACGADPEGDGDGLTCAQSHPLCP